MDIDEIIENLKQKSPEEAQFHQAVEEVAAESVRSFTTINHMSMRGYSSGFWCRIE